MKRQRRNSMLFAAAVVLGLSLGSGLLLTAQDDVALKGLTGNETPPAGELASAILAGGCFWCVESDFEKCPGVVDVISGYSGGRTMNPTYENYSQGGHREVVKVIYDPNKVTYAGLLEWLLKHIDPTDRRGSFVDRGLQYSPAAYYANQDQQEAAQRVISAIDDTHVYQGKVAIAVEPREEFWPAEEYHQDYHSKSLVKYRYYRYQSGRDAFVQKHWGDNANKLQLAGAFPSGHDQDGEEAQQKQQAATQAGSESTEEGKALEDKEQAKPWVKFEKPKSTELKRKLSPIQYKVTQQEGTEPAFRNDYWDNKKEGIYVDIVSGEPLFSSSDKFKSGTGWPSFVKPIDPKFLTVREDRGFFTVRTEVRSKVADSHLGHVFNDGPPARGGMRYCMNSAAMRFIPKDKMKEEGYEDYLPLVTDGGE